MYFGACYYPEQWPEERWATDAKLMREAGFNVVRIGEFAWNDFEPREGTFDFDWLDRCVALLANEGIRVILGTPTASPPKWIMDRHPELYKRDMYGHARGFGTRMHYCFNGPEYLPYVRNIVGAMAARYKDHPSVVGWQIDNEFGCSDTTWCYCDRCKAAFQRWLRSKYGTIEAVNEAWGTVVWNHRYASFEEIETPKLTVYQLHNPSLQLDFRRFSSDAVRDFMNVQVELLRAAAPRQPITHNMMGTFNEIDYYKLSETLDVAGLDLYPNFPHNERINPYAPALFHDATRGFKNANYWVLEHQSGTPGGNILKETPKPGELRRWTYQSIARGADAVVYFRWRTATFGAEEYWHGILQHSGVPGRKFEEVRRVGAEVLKLAPYLDGTTVRNDVAIVRSFDNDWAFAIQPHTPGYEYLRQVRNYHRYFVECGAGVDVVSQSADFGAYRVVILPNLAIVDDALADKIADFVEAGGAAVLDFRAGSKLPDNRMRAEVLPGPFGPLLGIAIDDYGIIPLDRKQRVTFEDDGTACEASVWYDVIEPNGAETVASFASDYFAGAPAITRRRHGRGLAYYVGTELDRAGVRKLLDAVLTAQGAMPAWTVDHPEVEVSVRSNGNRRVTFAINHASVPVSIRPPAGSVDLLAAEPGAACPGETLLQPNDVFVFLQEDSW
ncbi:beta-galactosidase [Paenibacillus sp.]|uniref:beta-galactosidase n=1 Tax=Paenibacillus sp. TaxID=58172 RepID=UPI002811F171|nr:beta-galactosidase [Paenibacillus sp.]